ncbi:DUF3866 family protein, partial [Isoptericola cucumis]|uniref:DUF3866 family protein n=1 Tax=Isoptericola cucumis TaxID=1776856 RepID=UPI0039F12F61
MTTGPNSAHHVPPDDRSRTAPTTEPGTAPATSPATSPAEHPTSHVTWRAGTVAARGRAWSGAREVTVSLDAALPNADAATDRPEVTQVRGLAYTTLVGDPDVGDRLLLNVSALARGLGTGGYGLVVGPAGPPGT